MAKLHGTPEERRAQKAARRAANRVGFVRLRAASAGEHELVVIACNAALAASRRISNSARRSLARAIAEAVEAHDDPTRKERS